MRVTFNRTISANNKHKNNSQQAVFKAFKSDYLYDSFVMQNPLPNSLKERWSRKLQENPKCIDAMLDDVWISETYSEINNGEVDPCHLNAVDAVDILYMYIPHVCDDDMKQKLINAQYFLQHEYDIKISSSIETIH